MTRTAFADGDEAFSGGWDQYRFDSEFEDLTKRLGSIGYIGYNPLLSPTRGQAELQHRDSPHIHPLPLIEIINDFPDIKDNQEAA